MTRQHLQRRLERLEEAVLPIENEPKTINVHYHHPDGTAELGQVIELPRRAAFRTGAGGRRRLVVGGRKW